MPLRVIARTGATLSSRLAFLPQPATAGGLNTLAAFDFTVHLPRGSHPLHLGFDHIAFGFPSSCSRSHAPLYRMPATDIHRY